MIITFVLIGKFLEVLSKKNASDTLDIIGKHIPSEINIIKDDKVISCALMDAKVGDIVVVASGEKVLLDGEILKGSGSFDESSLTGESEPVYKEIGDSVVSGTISIDADVHFKAIKDFEHSTLSNLVHLLDSAIAKKPKIEQLANTLSEYFSSVILALSFITFIVWWWWPHSFEVAFMVGISVIVIACPCALALATPVATLVGISIGASRGILFKKASHLETMAKVDTLVLDKTGTITVGKPEVVNEIVLEEFDSTLLHSLVTASKHPVAKGIAEYIKKSNENLTAFTFDTLNQLQALGIEAFVDGVEIYGGNYRLMQLKGIKVEHVSDKTLFFFAINKKLVAIYELSDKIKEGAEEIIKDLYSKKIDVIMLTGDNEKSAKKVAKEIGIRGFAERGVNALNECIGKLQYYKEMTRLDLVTGQCMQEHKEMAGMKADLEADVLSSFRSFGEINPEKWGTLINATGINPNFAPNPSKIAEAIERAKEATISRDFSSFKAYDDASERKI